MEKAVFQDQQEIYLCSYAKDSVRIIEWYYFALNTFWSWLITIGPLCVCEQYTLTQWKQSVLCEL